MLAGIFTSVLNRLILNSYDFIQKYSTTWCNEHTATQNVTHGAMNKENELWLLKDQKNGM